MSWRQDKQKRVLLSLIGGGLIAGLPLMLIQILALSDGRWWRPYADVLVEFAFWPIYVIEPVADALYPDKSYVDSLGDTIIESTIVNYEVIMMLAVVMSIAVYGAGVYALLSWLASRAKV